MRVSGDKLVLCTVVVKTAVTNTSMLHIFLPLYVGHAMVLHLCRNDADLMTDLDSSDEDVALQQSIESSIRDRYIPVVCCFIWY